MQKYDTKGDLVASSDGSLYYAADVDALLAKIEELLDQQVTFCAQVLATSDPASTPPGILVPAQSVIRAAGGYRQFILRNMAALSHAADQLRGKGDAQ